MTAKFWISAVVMFVLTFALSWGVHGGLLHADYMKMLRGCVSRRTPMR